MGRERRREQRRLSCDLQDRDDSGVPERTCIAQTRLRLEPSSNGQETCLGLPLAWLEWVFGVAWMKARFGCLCESFSPPERLLSGVAAAGTSWLCT